MGAERRRYAVATAARAPGARGAPSLPRGRGGAEEEIEGALEGRDERELFLLFDPGDGSDVNKDDYDSGVPPEPDGLFTPAADDDSCALPRHGADAAHDRLGDDELTTWCAPRPF